MAKSSLVAIVLAIKSSGGESLVFHYPCDPFAQQKDQKSSPVDVNDADDSDSSYLSVDFRRKGSVDRARSGDSYLDGAKDGDEQVLSQSGGHQDLPWTKVLGFDAALLADLLTPQKSDAKFEMWIDELVFLGNPVSRKADGTWMKQKPKRSKASTIDQSSEATQRPMKETTVLVNKKSHSSPANATMIDVVASSGSPMTSFHLVFVVNPEVDAAYQNTIKEMYDNVVVQLTSALTYEQARCDFVWAECQLILRMKDVAAHGGSDAAELWQRIAVNSELARVIIQTYEAVSRSNIAHLSINDSINLSLVIPTAVSSAVLPQDSMRQHPFLTTAISFGTNIDESDEFVVPYYALILLDDTDQILANLPQSSSRILVDFVKAVRPTLTFKQLANSLEISQQEVYQLARHLIQWRCARPIPPLHPRNIYVMSPTSDISRLPQQTEVFAKRFPTLPSLPKILSILGRKIMPFRQLIPTRDHRSIYLDLLTRLMRENWIMELKTFVWINVRKEVKIRVLKEEQGQDAEGSELEDSIIPDPYSASAKERQWLRKLSESHSPEDSAVFDRICKYFNGKHAMEKVAIREQISRRVLRNILESYDADLVKAYFW